MGRLAADPGLTRHPGDAQRNGLATHKQPLQLAARSIRLLAGPLAPLAVRSQPVGNLVALSDPLLPVCHRDTGAMVPVVSCALTLWYARST